REDAQRRSAVMAPVRKAPHVGRSMLRREDRRLLLGTGQYVADLVLPGMLHAAFVRSPVAHARIRALDLTRAAAAPGVALVLIGELAVAKGNAESALASAPHRLQRRFHHHRYAALPIECRGVVSAYDARTQSLTVWSATQVVHWVRREVAATLGMPEASVRCVALDVGGGFGVKGHVYPEDLLIPFLARRLERPVKWIEDRHEHLMASCHARDHTHDVEIGF